MLTLGDGIAIAGLFLLLIAVMAKWRTPMVDKYVTRDTCIATTKGIEKQLDDIKKSATKLFEKMDSLDKWLREHSYTVN